MKLFNFFLRRIKNILCFFSRPSSEEWENKNFIFLAGLHRSGTSILHETLRKHKKISGFKNTGAPEDEAQHLQTVYLPAHRCGGPGSFAFSPNAHLTEKSELLTEKNKRKLKREWGIYLNFEKKIFIEKSPINIIISRFLQACFKKSCFVFLVRHPIAVSLATQKWSSRPLIDLFSHWYTAHGIMLNDLPYIDQYILVRYEDLCFDSKIQINGILNLVALDDSIRHDTIIDQNYKYFSHWNKEKKNEAIIKQFSKPPFLEINAFFGYSLEAPYVGKPSEAFFKSSRALYS